MIAWVATKLGRDQVFSSSRVQNAKTDGGSVLGLGIRNQGS